MQYGKSTSILTSTVSLRYVINPIARKPGIHSQLCDAVTFFSSVNPCSACLLPFTCSLGSNLEVLYELRRFGISGDAIPVNPDGTLKIRRHLEYIEECKRTEEIERQRRSSPPVSSSNGNKPIYIDIPGPNDGK